MNWKEMTPQQKNRFIAEELFGHEIYAAFAPGSETELDYGMLVPDADGTKRIEALPPYSTDMNTAWLIVKHIDRAHAFKLKEAFMEAINEVAHHLSEPDSVSDEWDTEHGLLMHGFPPLSADVICFAAWHAIGVLDETDAANEEAYE